MKTIPTETGNGTHVFIVAVNRLKVMALEWI
jgi:hypothetical protein